METNRVNGFLFEKLLYNGLANLRLMEQVLNSLNVFPVADGDTGTNMRLTLENGLRYAKSNEHLSEYLHTLNEGLLLGARGNSGVILSQIFRGMAQNLANCTVADCEDMCNAFIQGYKTAYQAVVQPVEGTILTVSRGGIEHILNKINNNTTIKDLFVMYVEEMKKILEHTPEMLDILKASGVVDSGAFGYITVIEGMSKYLNGDIVKNDYILQLNENQINEDQILSLSSFNEKSVFVEGYCMEFILQLLKYSPYVQEFELNKFIETIEPYGNSIAATQDKTRVKVHIHTKTPSPIIQISQKYGEFLTFKLENMQFQHNEQIAKKKNIKENYTKPLGIVAVYNGEGMKHEFEELGCEVTIDGGLTMNPPSSDFLTAYNEIDAENIIVLPNSKNVIRAAEQAAGLTKRKNIHILSTTSVAEGFFAAAMDVGNCDDVEKRIESIKKGAENVKTLSVALAKKHYEDDQIICEPGDYIAIFEDKVIYSASTPIEAFIGGFSKLENAENYETCMIFCGDTSTTELEDKLEEAIYDNFNSLEVKFINGGQHTYLWICGII